MKNLQKNLNFILVIIAVFSVLTFAFNSGCVFAADASSSSVGASSQEQVSASSDNASVNKDDAKEATSTEDLKGVNAQPMAQQGLKFGLIKFLVGMFGVLISSFAIFLGLKLYKKFVLKNNVNPAKIDYSKTLESPRDFKEAINIFLDKTDKK